MSEYENAPEARLLIKLAPIIGDLSQRGSLARGITICRDDQRHPSVIHFTITATYRRDERDLYLEANRLCAMLALGGFHLHDPKPALGNAIEVGAAISIDDLCGTPSRKAGTPGRTIN